MDNWGIAAAVLAIFFMRTTNKMEFVGIAITLLIILALHKWSDHQFNNKLKRIEMHADGHITAEQILDKATPSKSNKKV